MSPSLPPTLLYFAVSLSALLHSIRVHKSELGKRDITYITHPLLRHLHPPVERAPPIRIRCPVLPALAEIMRIDILHISNCTIPFPTFIHTNNQDFSLLHRSQLVYFFFHKSYPFTIGSEIMFQMSCFLTIFSHDNIDFKSSCFLFYFGTPCA